ncbi:hypothetical protein B5K06_31955 [Rhizobium grahamii]|uniref:Uncharacterized protein n=1 Tax=Rhizobium grahamii TaxID=1120045 RepID=A0A370KEQ6_9HYPH|nr:hypothetical protein B5K06_31955 [Rhizobium grahamii]
MVIDQQSVRYRVEPSITNGGKWAVVELHTRLPAIVEGVGLTSLSSREANDLVELMNSRERHANSATSNA